jgi:hypothetical protein
MMKLMKKELGTRGSRKETRRKKERIKLEAESENLASKIDEFVKSKESMTLKTLEAKAIMTDKKNEMK